ncbi:MAG TPA: trypsin-like serine protease [Solirubrobacterales bacterium]
MPEFGLNSIATPRGRLLIAAIVFTAILFGYAYAQGSAAEPTDEARDVGIAEAEARILEANLAGRIEAALGDSSGGVWFDRSTGELHVGVTSPDSRQRAEAVADRAGLSELVTETPVDSTWEQLTAAQQALNRHLEDVFARGQARTSALPDSNSVTVELASTVTASRRAALQREASRTGVDVAVIVSPARSLAATPALRCAKFVANKANCDKPIAAGVRIKSKNGFVCTAGPAVILQDLSTAAKSTATYILTAGHCIKKAGAGSEWFALTKAEVGGEILIGKAKEALWGEKGLADKVDVGVIEVEKPGNWVHETDTPVTPGIVQWDNTGVNEVDPTATTGTAVVPVKGTKVCLSGQTSGKSCGTIFAPSVTIVEEEGGVFYTVETLAEVEGSAATNGDSGGPWYPEAEPDKVLGTFSAFTTIVEGGMNKNRKWFQPLATSLSNLATPYQLLTTTNEKRKHPAAGPPFTSSAYPAVVTGSNTKGAEVFTAEAGKVECNSHFEGTLPGVTTTLALKPAYTGCSAFGFEATMNVEGCTYELHSTEKVEANVRRSHVDVVCPAGQSIKITASTCKAEIKSQNSLTTAKTTNEGGKIKITWELTGIAYTVTQDGFLCPFNGTGTKTNATYAGSVVLSTSGGGSIDVGE